MPEIRKMSLVELKAIVQKQINNAETDKDTPYKRGLLFDSYMGEPYGDEVESRSSVVMSDVADTIEWIMPALMDIFASGDKVVEFTAVGPEDEEAAAQETEVINHVFMNQNQGFLVLYSWFKDALIQKNGYVKRMWDDAEKTTTEVYSGLTEDELVGLTRNILLDGNEFEVLEQDQSEDDGTFEVKLRIITKTGRARVETTPQEEVLVAARHNSIYLDQAPAVIHKRKRTVSDLIADGYDMEQARRLPSAEDDEFTDERYKRHTTEDSTETEENEPSGDMMRETMIYECYLYVDFDGDGQAELRKVTVGGSTFDILKFSDGSLDNDEVDEIPFDALTPIIIPHRHVGRSVAELVDDLQRIKTVLIRQLLDNIYLNNNARTELPDGSIGENTIDDLLNPRPGGIVRTKGPGMREIAPTPIVGEILPVVETMEQTRENRTGITRFNQGLEADNLNNTAHGIERVMTAGEQKIKLIARIFAETGVRHMFLGLHKMLRQHSSRPLALKLRGKWVQVDPREWKERDDMTVSTALGSGSKQVMLSQLMNILEIQKEGIQVPQLGLVTAKNIHNTVERIVENAGLGSPELYFSDPTLQPPQQAQGQEQEDPAVALAKAEVFKTQQREADSQRDAQLKLLEMRMEDDRKRDEMELNAILEAAKLGVQMDIAQIRAITDRDRNDLARNAQAQNGQAVQ